MDSNHRPLAYETNELPTAPPRILRLCGLSPHLAAMDYNTYLLLAAFAPNLKTALNFFSYTQQFRLSAITFAFRTKYLLYFHAHKITANKTIIQKIIIKLFHFFLFL